MNFKKNLTNLPVLTKLRWQRIQDFPGAHAIIMVKVENSTSLLTIPHQDLWRSSCNIGLISSSSAGGSKLYLSSDWRVSTSNTTLKLTALFCFIWTRRYKAKSEHLKHHALILQSLQTSRLRRPEFAKICIPWLGSGVGRIDFGRNLTLPTARDSSGVSFCGLIRENLIWLSCLAELDLRSIFPVSPRFASRSFPMEGLSSIFFPLLCLSKLSCWVRDLLHKSLNSENCFSRVWQFLQIFRGMTVTFTHTKTCYIYYNA